MSLVSMNGTPLNPVLPSGFYVVAECPECGDPIFYHNAGEVVVPATAFVSGRTEQVGPALFKTCSCDIDVNTVEVRVPDKYNFNAERASIDVLFQAFHGLLERYEHLTTLSIVGGPDADEDESRGDREPGILQFPKVRPDTRSED